MRLFFQKWPKFNMLNYILNSKCRSGIVGTLTNETNLTSRIT